MASRDWRAAVDKVRQEGKCRVCGSTSYLETSHTIARGIQDVEHVGPRGGCYLFVHPDSVVPLCKEHHELYDAHRLDLLPYLTIDEQHNAIDGAGGLELARKRLTGGAT